MGNKYNFSDYIKNTHLVQGFLYLWFYKNKKEGHYVRITARHFSKNANLFPEFNKVIC